MECGIWSLMVKHLLAVQLPKSGIPTEKHLTESITKNRIMGKQTLAILRLLKSAGYELSTLKIAEHFGKDADTIGRALRDLRDKGIIVNGESEYIDGKARLTWKLADPDYEISEKKVVEDKKTTLLDDPEIRTAFKTLLQLIINKL